MIKKVREEENKKKKLKLLKAKKMVRRKTPPKKKKNRVNEEIRRLQRSNDLLLRKAPFIRLVKEITASITHVDMRYQVAAMEVFEKFPKKVSKIFKNIFQKI